MCPKIGFKLTQVVCDGSVGCPKKKRREQIETPGAMWTVRPRLSTKRRSRLPGGKWLYKTGAPRGGPSSHKYKGTLAQMDEISKKEDRSTYERKLRRAWQQKKKKRGRRGADALRRRDVKYLSPRRLVRLVRERTKESQERQKPEEDIRLVRKSEKERSAVFSEMGEGTPPPPPKKKQPMWSPTCVAESPLAPSDGRA